MNRDWQSRCLTVCQERAPRQRDLLVSATPGAGKTTLALLLAGALRPSSVHVVAHTRQIRRQWRDAALARGLAVTTTTYQALASDPETVAATAAGALAVLDEPHHAAEKRAWGLALRTAFGASRWRLLLSGTPWREDEAMIPFVRYDASGTCQPDFSYTYDEALRDGVCRPVRFEPVNMLARFRDKPSATIAADMLRRSLDPDAGMIEAMARAADAELTRMRALPDLGDAAGLLVAVDVEHARRCAAILQSIAGECPVIVTSDSATAARDLARFKSGRERWLVAVKMVTEGVDIPRLMVGAYCTTIVTTLFVRQFVGRFVRTRGERNPATVFVPRDPRLLQEAEEIGAEVRRSAGPAASPSLAPVVPRRQHACTETYRPVAR